MSDQLAKLDDAQHSVLEAVVVNGDLSKLQPHERVAYYTMRCDAAGLDPRTQPLMYVTLQGKLTLYATKAATEQLCEKRGLCCEIVKDDWMANDLYRVHARCRGKDGRSTDNIGVVNVAGKKGDDLANAMMKAVTKAFRRSVLAHCGMGLLDETEVETIPGASFPEPLPELATEEELEKYHDARKLAIDLNYRTPKGNLPVELAIDTPRAEVLKRTKVLSEWIDQQAKAEPPAESTQPDAAEETPEAEVVEEVAA